MNQEGRLDPRFRHALAAFPARLRPGLIHVLELPDEERAQPSASYTVRASCVTLAELLIDLEEEPDLRLVMLEELRKLQAMR